jgi:ribonuclease HI
MDKLAGSGVVAEVVGEDRDLTLEKERALGTNQTVYFAELDGLLHGLDSLLPILPSLACTSLTLCTNNQAVLLAPVNPSPTSGQQLGLLIRQQLQELNGMYPGLHITLLWSPGPLGLAANKEADELAKEGVELGRSILREEARAVRERVKAVQRSQRSRGCGRGCGGGRLSV